MTIIGEAFVRVSPEGTGFARKLQAQMQGAGLGNVGVIAGAAIVAGIGVGLSHIGAEFGKARRILTQEVGVASKDIDGLFASVRRSAEEVPGSLDKIAQATATLFKRGVPLGSQLDKLAKQELFLAKITGTDLASNVEQTTALFAKFNVPLREQSKALDVLFKAQQRSGKGLGELIAPLQSGGAALQEFGFDLSKSAALITNLQVAGVNVAPALAALRKAFGQLAKEGKDPQEALRGLIEEFKSGQNPAAAMADAMKLFGSRAGLELARAIKSGRFEIDSLLKSITDGKGGIIETGEATLTLADRFSLLRARAEENFADLGISVRKALVGVVVAASEPLERVAASVGHLFSAVAPLGVIFAPLALALSGVLPAVGAFASGLDAIASVLDQLRNPVVAVGVTIALLGANFAAIISIVNQAVVALRAFTIAALSNPYVATAAAIVGIGVAVQLFRKQADPAVKVAQNFQNAMMETESATTIFKGGVESAAKALEALFTAQAKAKESSSLKTVLAGASSTVDQLTAAVLGSETAWAKYATAAIDAARASGVSGVALGAFIAQLKSQRDAFGLYAKAQADAAIETDVLTRAQKNAIVAQHRFADGSVDLAAVLDDINGRLRNQTEEQDKLIEATASTRDVTRELASELASSAISAADAESEIGNLGLSADAAASLLEKVKANAALLTAEQDKLSLSSIETSRAYGVLAEQIASGSISQVDATQTLEDMGLSAAGATTAFGDLATQVSTFIDGALSALPTVADAIQAFNQAVSGDKTTITSDLEKHVELQKQLAEAGGAASEALKTSILENNAAIKADFQKLADDSNPQKFTDNLLANAQQIKDFTANLQTLVDAKLGSLAGDLAKLGPETAGALAASLAASPGQAKVANAASVLAGKATDSYKKFLETNIGPLTLTGEAAGRAIGTGIAKGIIGELLKQIPELRRFGIGAADEVHAGAKERLDAPVISDALKASLSRHIPEFRGLGVPIGSNVVGGAKDGIDRADLGTSIESAIRRGGGKVRGAGRELGAAAGGGIVEGIRSQFGPVGDAILAITQHGVAVAKGAWRVQSPSQVFAEIGSQVGAGLALGITGSAADVNRAASLLASEATTSVTNALDVVAFAPEFSPTITPVVEPIVLPPIPSPTVDVTASLAPLAPVELDAAFGPVASPVVAPVAIDASVNAAVPSFDPVVLSGSFAPVTPPTVPTTTIDATVTASLPTFDPVVLSGSLAPIPAPTFDPVVISASVPPIATPAFDPVVISASLAPVEQPTFEPLVLAAALAPIAQPTFDPVVLDGTLTPVAAPDVPPVVIQSSLAPFTIPVPAPIEASLAPIAAPDVPGVIIPASLAPFEVPAPAPLDVTFGALAAPDVPSVVIPSTLAPFTVPALPPLDATVAPISTPDLDPVVLDATLAPFVVPSPPPIEASLAPLTVPPVDGVVVPSTLQPFTVPPVAPIDVTFADLPPLDVPGVVVPSTLAPFTVPQPPPIETSLAPVDAPAIDPVVIPASLGALPAVTVPPLVTTFADLPPFDVPPVVVDASLGPVGQPTVEPIETTFAPFPQIEVPPVETSFAPIVLPTIPALHATIAPVPSQDVEAAFSGVGAAAARAGVTAAEGLSQSVSTFVPTFANALDELNTRIRDVIVQRSGETISEWNRRIREIIAQRSGESINEWKARIRELVGDFKTGFGEIKTDSEQLRRFLAALGGTRLAFDAPPSKITIAAAAQSVQVAKPEDRANAQTPPAVRGPVVGQLVFNEKIDPLHVADEIAWLNL